MNSFLSLVCGLLLAGHALAGSSVQVQVRSESENKSTSSKAVEKVRAHWLAVRVSSTSGAPLEGYTLRWTLYAANLQRGSDEVRVERSGDITFSVGTSPHFVDLTTPHVPFSWTPQHSERSGSSRRAVYKVVPETGHRYHGYRVQVLNGDTVVADLVSNEALRKLK